MAAEHTLSARAFVDASGEGDLAQFAGAATRDGNDGAVNLGTLATRFGGIPRDVTVTADQLTAAVQAAKAAGRGPFSKDRSVLTRLPISGDVVCDPASEDYDPRDVLSQSAAERRGRQQAWAYLDVLRSLPGCTGAYLASTGPSSAHASCDTSRQCIGWPGRRWSRAGRSPTASRSAPGAWNGTIARRCRAASSIRRTRQPMKSRCAAW